ncbi:MAG: PilX N-terminal domain-containing pilus assembly protein [Pseudomonadota bacterium]
MPTHRIAPPRLPAQQRGAALIVGLVLLLVMTLLGVTGINSNTLDLVMAGNAQHSQDAFEAAESAIQAEVLRGPLEDIAVPRVTEDYQFNAGVTADATVTYSNTQLPPPGYSITEYRSDHYEVDSLGQSARGARSNHVQGFFVVVPSGLGEN